MDIADCSLNIRHDPVIDDAAGLYSRTVYFLAEIEKEHTELC